MIKDPTNPPFVTVVVLTFNSAKTVIETLESVRTQERCAIELVVADDCSTDGTQDLVRQWVDANASAFVNCHMLFNPVNAGICQNVTRAYTAARGEWIKPIAGDDILMPSALFAFCEAGRRAAPDVGAIIGRVHTFTGNGAERSFGDILPPAGVLEQLQGRAADLLERLVRTNTIPAPGVFVRKSAFEACGGADEEFVHLDDWPLWINMLEHGMRFETIQDVIVGYRVHGGSISARRSAPTIDRRYLRDMITFHQRYQCRYFPLLERIDGGIYALRWYLALDLFRNKPSAYAATTLLHVFSPLQWRKLFNRMKTATPSGKH